MSKHVSQTHPPSLSHPISLSNSGEVSVFSSCHLDVGDYLGSDDEDEDAITHNNDVTIKIEDEDNKKRKLHLHHF